MLILGRDTGQRHHVLFRDILAFLRPRSLLVLNDTRVIPARLRGAKPSGGGIEVLLTRRIGGAALDADRWSEDWEVLTRGLGSAPAGTLLRITDDVTAELLVRGDRGAATVRFRGATPGGVLALAEATGAIPLPPYIESARRESSRQGDGGDGAPLDDRTRYQTVYARAPGAVAAPTAGLHFTEALLGAIEAAGHELARVTLHVGPGTFRPVESDDPRAHRIDPEWYEVSAQAAEAVNRARAEGRPIVAVGTTVVRVLETLGRAGRIQAGGGATELFVLPGDAFHVVTDLVTNFHLPRSTLLMLVAAFAGRDRVLAAYEEAVQLGYRFYSYGDAMFIRPGELPS